MKLTIEFSEKATKKLDTIRRRTNLRDPVDVVQRAMAIYDEITLCMAVGGVVMIGDKKLDLEELE